MCAHSPILSRERLRGLGFWCLSRRQELFQEIGPFRCQVWTPQPPCIWPRNKLLGLLQAVRQYLPCKRGPVLRGVVGQPRTHEAAHALFGDYLAQAMTEIRPHAAVERWGRCGYASGAHPLAALGLDYKPLMRIIFSIICQYLDDFSGYSQENISQFFSKRMLASHKTSLAKSQGIDN